MMKKLFLLTVVIAIAFAAQTASAGAIAVANAGFESYSGGGDPTWQNPVDSWSFASNEGGFAASRGEGTGNYPTGGAPEGNLYLNIYKNTWIWQMTAADLKTTGVYSLSYEVSDSNSDDGTWVSIAIYAGEQWGAGTNQVSTAFYLKTMDTDLSDKEFHTASMTWDTEDAANTAFVAANAGDSIWVRITAGPYLGNPSAWFYVDDVQLSWTPEPATIALLGLGGLLLRRKRR